VRLLDPANRVRRRQEQPVVGADEEAAVTGSQRKRPPMAADARVDDREVDADGHVRKRVAQHERALQDLLRRDAVRDVDDLRVRRDRLDHPVAGADEVVLKPEVGKERDHHGPGAYDVRAAGAARETASIKPSRSCRRASAMTSTPAASATRVVSGPIETAGNSSPSCASASAADAEARTTRSPSGSGSGLSPTVR